MSEEQIIKRLEDLGYKPGEIRMALKDVAKVIIARTAAAYFSILPQSEQEQIKNLPEEDVQAYISEHQDSMPKMPQEEFEKIHDDTWEEYFSAMTQ